MHRLLQRQLKKSFGSTDGFPENVQRFIEAVEDAYTQSDEDRALNERSMELSSKELFDRNQELATAEKKYRAIFNNVTEGIFQATPAGRYLSANPSMAKIFAYDSAQDLQNSVTDIGTQIYVEPGQRAEMLAMIERDGQIASYYSQVRRKDGALIWISETARAVKDGAGNVIYYEGSIHDITRRKQMQAERAELQSRLISISRQAGMAEVASGVLHNVGNVLNSINVSATLTSERLRSSKLPGIAKATKMLIDNREQLSSFLTTDEKGRQIPEYLARLSEHLETEQKNILGEMTSLIENIEHVKRIVSMQQGYAKTIAVVEEVHLPEIVEDALRLNQESLERHRMDVIRELGDVPVITIDKHQVLQILVNLVSNAKHAMRGRETPRKLTIRGGACPEDSNCWFIEVSDTGMGIAKENLERIFSHGFTTRADGHGFGLHSSILAAQAMSGSLTAHSDGPGTGATFTLKLPISAAQKPQDHQRAA